MKRSALIVAVILSVGLTFAYAQQAPIPQAKPQYRVMSLAEMFKGDEAAMKKVYQIAVSVSVDGKPLSRVRRTDMDGKDYEKALNRLAVDGWKLVEVTKSNYWVFTREH